jgi:hypothetical protein
MMQKREISAIHFIICLGLIFFFGSSFHSLSADFPQHFGLVYALMKTGVADPQWIGVMAGYPRLAHWMAAGLGYLTGSGIVAMWLLSIVSIYACYFSLGRIATSGVHPAGSLFFAALVLALVSSRAIIGFEIIGNFFYPQLIGTAIYCVTLLVLIAIGHWNALVRVLLVLGLFAFTLEVHTVPALHMAGAFGLLLVLELTLEFIRSKRVGMTSIMAIVLFAVGALLVLWFDPSLRAAIVIAQHDGTLIFGLSAGFLTGMAVVAGGIAARILWTKLRSDQSVTTADLVTFAALWAAIGLVLAQYAAITLFGNGSPYIVKKHLFIVLTLGIVSLARSAGYMLPNPKLRPSLPILTALVAAAVCTIILRGPAISLYPMVHDLAYAERAASFPEFKPGNTLVAAESLHPVVRYLISITAFKAKLDDPKSLSLIDESSTAEQDTDFVMLDRSPALVATCKERHAETPRFVIVPASCLGQLSPDDLLLSFGAAGNGGAHLSSGWWPQEAWGVWERDSPAVITVQLPPGLRNADLNMLIKTNAFVVPQKPTLTVDVAVNGKQVATLLLPPARQPTSIPIPRQSTEDGVLKIVFTAKDAVSPASVGHNADGRVLGIGLKTLKFSKAAK